MITNVKYLVINATNSNISRCLHFRLDRIYIELSTCYRMLCRHFLPALLNAAQYRYTSIYIQALYPNRNLSPDSFASFASPHSALAWSSMKHANPKHCSSVNFDLHQLTTVAIWLVSRSRRPKTIALHKNAKAADRWSHRCRHRWIPLSNISIL